jgi:hypothetical protein
MLIGVNNDWLLAFLQEVLLVLDALLNWEAVLVVLLEV